MCYSKGLAFISYYQKMTQADMNGKKKYFKCFELFYKKWKNLPTEIKAKYYDALMEYGLYWTEPTDPVILSLMQWAMYSIDKFEAHKEKTSKSMLWNSNAVDTWEKHTKQIETDWNRWKQMLSDGSIEEIEEEKENKKEKEREDDLSVSVLLDALKNDSMIMHKIKDASIMRPRLEYKQKKKSTSYKTIVWFKQQMIVYVNLVSHWEIRYDVDLRLKFAINQATENWWKGLVRDDKVENSYQWWLKIYTLTNKQNE